MADAVSAHWPSFIPKRYRNARFWLTALAGLLLLVLPILGIYMSGLIGVAQIFVMLIGAAVGAVELLGRYRHAPLRALITGSGIMYLLINVAASWAAYYLIEAYQVFKNVAVAKETTQILTAGFGSLVFMRSSLFKVRVADSDIGIGPAAILDTVLLVADRGVDRREAVARAQDVTALLQHVGNPNIVAKMLTKYSLALMQNVDTKTTNDLVDAINKILADKETPDDIKIDIVALTLGVVVGPDVLEASVEALGARLIDKAKTDPIAPPPSPPPAPAPPPPAPEAAPPADPQPATGISLEMFRKELSRAEGANLPPAPAPAPPPVS